MEAMNKKTPSTVVMRVLKKQNLAGNYWSVWLDGKLDYEAGQYISIKVNDEGERRSYSLASYPGEDGLQIVVDVTPMGKGSKYILELKEDDEVEVLGPIGGLEVAGADLGSETEGFLFVGTGSGVTPLRSMVFDLLESKKENRPIRLSWGMRYEKDLFWTEEFLELQKKYDNFKFDLVLSRPDGRWPHCVGHVEDCLVNHGLDFSKWQIYLCGNQEMIKEVEIMLREKGVAEEAINIEKF